MGKVIPEDVHAGCVEEAERLRQELAESRRTERQGMCLWCGHIFEMPCSPEEAKADPSLLASVYAQAAQHDQECEWNPLRRRLYTLEQEIRAQLAERDAMVEEAADEMAASVQAALMDAQHDHAHTLETERRLRACLARYAHALIRNGALSRPSIGGQTVTAWKCGLCGSEQASGSTAHDYVCEVCRAGLIEHAKGEERARAEGKPAEGGKC
jgi:hypothetical protein